MLGPNAHAIVGIMPGTLPPDDWTHARTGDFTRSQARQIQMWMIKRAAGARSSLISFPPLKARGVSLLSGDRAAQDAGFDSLQHHAGGRNHRIARIADHASHGGAGQ